jgi:hypothetical protein
MKNFIKQNWFKILIIILIGFFVLLNRYYFMHLNAATIFKCDKLTGSCILEEIKFPAE